MQSNKQRSADALLAMAAEAQLPVLIAGLAKQIDGETIRAYNKGDK